MSKVIASLGTGAQSRLLALASRSFRRYARRHGYELELCRDVLDPARPAPWSKIVLIAAPDGVRPGPLDCPLDWARSTSLGFVDGERAWSCRARPTVPGRTSCQTGSADEFQGRADVPAAARSLVRPRAPTRADPPVTGGTGRGVLVSWRDDTRRDPRRPSYSI
jgi:hypothetical protein